MLYSQLAFDLSHLYYIHALIVQVHVCCTVGGEIAEALVSLLICTVSVKSVTWFGSY